MEFQERKLPIDETMFEKMYTQWNLRKAEDSSLVFVGKDTYEQTIGNVNNYSSDHRKLRQEIINLENQILELQGRLSTLSAGYSILANTLIETELAGEKKRSLGKFLVIVLEFAQVTLDKMLMLHDGFDKIRDELANSENKRD